MSGNTSKLRACSFGCAVGITWALGMLIVGWGAWLCNGWGMAWVNMMGSVYVGYHPTLIGGIIGAIWGFVDFFIFGVVVAWIYNGCSTCCASKCESNAPIE